MLSLMSATEQVIEKIRKMSSDQVEELLAYLEQKQNQEAEEDRLDVEAARRGLAEPGENVPWEKVKADLGLM